MKKKSVNSEKRDIHIPVFGSPRTFGQRAADGVTKAAGSWTFIILFLFFIALWVYVNIRFLAQYNLGVCYYQGRGVAVSHEEAIHYLELAVRQKQPKAAEALEVVMMAAYRPKR